MKNYLIEELNEDEKNEIIGIIKVTARSFKYREYRKKYNVKLNLEDIEIPIYDSYLIDNYDFKNYEYEIEPISELDKTEIVNKLNKLMDNMELFEFKRALSFNEKLVFYFTYMYREIYLLKDVAVLLSMTERTIYNKRESIKKKINFIMEVL